MSAEAFVQFRVTPEMKTLLRTLAEREQVTESALVRQLLEVMLRRSAVEGFPKAETLERRSLDARLSISLAPEDRMLLCERATARGMQSATYVSVLVRSHLRNLTPLTKEELTALKRSVAELGAIVRNLNQIARAADLVPDFRTV
jgi:predicted DNA-binding protein